MPLEEHVKQICILNLKACTGYENIPSVARKIQQQEAQEKKSIESAKKSKNEL